MRPKDQEKREAIKRATFDLVAEQGVIGLKMAEIAKLAGISVSTLYVYFPDKEQLVATLFREVMRDLTAALLRTYQPGQAYKATLRQFWAAYLDYRMTHKPEGNFLEAVKATQPLQNLVADIKSTEMLLPMELMRQGREQLLVKEYDEALLVAAIGGMMQRMTQLFASGQLPYNEEQVERSFVLMWDCIKA